RDHQDTASAADRDERTITIGRDAARLPGTSRDRPDLAVEPDLAHAAHARVWVVGGHHDRVGAARGDRVRPIDAGRERGAHDRAPGDEFDAIDHALPRVR